MHTTISGRAYVVGDNIDTDQIIPARHLALVPTIAAEYQRLGTYALSGLPQDRYPQRLVEPGRTESAYAIVIAGRNFGCGSSREHAPLALGAARVRAVVAESFARIFYRNCIATGELLPLESRARLCDSICTGDQLEIDIEAGTLRVASRQQDYALRPVGAAAQVVAAGGLFAYARQQGLIPTQGGAP
jgi:3-isopropylmalate/(R)-2-methylmalate dehydratase small subunit